MGEYLRNKCARITALVLHAVWSVVGRESTWTEQGLQQICPLLQMRWGMVRKNRDHVFVHRFLPVSAGAQDGGFVKNLSFLCIGRFCACFGKEGLVQLLERRLLLRLRLLSVIPLILRIAASEGYCLGPPSLLSHLYRSQV